MKRSIIILLAISIACLCGCSFNTPPKVETKSYNTPSDSMYLQCSDLKGIGMFEMGMSWNAVMNSKTLRIDSWHKRANWYNGNWGVHDFEIEKWLINNYPAIKQFNVEVSSDVFAKKYSLGDIEFRRLDLAFLNDKLVAAYFEFSSDKNVQEALNHYIEKYGEGVGEFYSSHWSNGLSGDDYACDVTEKDSRKWENEIIALQYVYDYRLLSYPKRDNKRGLYWHDNHFIVYDKQGYPVFEEQLKKAKEDFKNKQDKAHSDALNSL